MESPRMKPFSHRSSSLRSKKKLVKKELRQKENGFVLDCLNSEQSKLKVYHSISDKNLNYFVIRAHPNLKKSKQHSLSSKAQKNEKISHMRFQQMLQRQKQKILSPQNAPQIIELGEIQSEIIKDNQLSENNKILDQITRSIRYKAKEHPIQQQESFAQDSP